MRSCSALISVLAYLVLAAGVDAQLVTYTIPVLDGNTVLISTGTNALGVPTTQTVSTIWSTGVATNTALTSSSSSSSSSSSFSRTTLLDDPDTETDTDTTTSTTAAVTTTDADGRPTTTTQRGNVGQPPETTNGPPMRTTTYWYDPGDGNWVEATWTASNTVPPSQPTVTVPEGSIQDYNQYQTSVNRAVISAAEAADSRRNGTSGAGPRIAAPIEAGLMGVAGWTAMLAGVAGMGWGVYAL